jgi:uncharacterized membrane protein YdjX (TVP38/TMEM64 family)
MRQLKVLIGIAATAALVWLWLSGQLSELADRQRVATLVGGMGPFGPALFILLIVALFPVFLIGPPIWASAAVWAPPLAVLYSTAGCIVASFVFYALARLLGQSWAQRHIPDKLRRYEDRLMRAPFRTVLAMRLVLWANPALDLLIGISRVPPRSYLLATAIGLLPSTAVQVLVMGKAIALALQLPSGLWAAIAGAIAAGLLIRAHLRRRRAAAMPVPASHLEAEDG